MLGCGVKRRACGQGREEKWGQRGWWHEGISQGTPTQLHQHQVWVFRCQISQILRKETQKQSAGGGCDAKSNARVPTARSSILKAGEDLSGCKEHSHKSWMLRALHLTCPAEMDPSALSFPYL